MRRALPLLLAAACAQYREVSVSFGKTGEGLGGFLCRESSGRMLLDRLASDAGTYPASLVTDLVGLENGQPGCRTGQLLEWCQGHVCKPMRSYRDCQTVVLPTGLGTLPRDEALAAVHAQVRTLSGTQVVQQAPDEFVILRMVATAQPCAELMETGGSLPPFDPTKLVGCAYSCPTLFDRAEGSVYLGFETLTGMCEQGVRICASDTLNWMP